MSNKLLFQYHPFLSANEKKNGLLMPMIIKKTMTNNTKHILQELHTVS